MTKLENIFNDDPYGLLEVDNEASKIFDLTHIKKVDKITKVMPDYIAMAEEYDLSKDEEKLFQNIQPMLKKGTLKQSSFNSTIKIKKGLTFAIGGVLGIIKNDKLKHKTDSDGRNRLEVIFENGTKTYLLKESLVTGLYKRGIIILS